MLVDMMRRMPRYGTLPQHTSGDLGATDELGANPRSASVLNGGGDEPGNHTKCCNSPAASLSCRPASSAVILKSEQRVKNTRECRSRTDQALSRLSPHSSTRRSGGRSFPSPLACGVGSASGAYSVPSSCGMMLR